MDDLIKEAALHFHEYPNPGKIQITPTKPLATQYDLSLAYSPGVAAPCMEIYNDPLASYKYTARGNLVAVISNGTAVLGLGNIGALAGKPVMEGKGVLFKKFAGIDVFDLEVNETDPDKIVDIIASLEPTFGGINLEDIKAPECFEIERALIEGAIDIDDIPALWDEKMMLWLGRDTRGDFRDGPMQDVHWPSGLFGYFPCYTLGAMYAAQWFATMRRQTPDLDARIAASDLAPVFDWLHDHVWRQGARWTTPELTRRASGETLNPAHFRAHLERRYLG